MRAQMIAVYDRIQFCTIAGCHNAALQYAFRLLKLSQSRWQILFREGKLLSNFNGCTAVIQTHYYNVHAIITCL